MGCKKIRQISKNTVAFFDPVWCDNSHNRWLKMTIMSLFMNKYFNLSGLSRKGL